MGLLRSVVDTGINNMSAEERVEAIHEVATLAIELMTPDERRDLTNRILGELLGTMDSATRHALVAGAIVPSAVSGE